MTDTSLTPRHVLQSEQAQKRRRARHAANSRMRLYGVGAITIAIGLLGVLFFTLALGGYTAFTQTHVHMQFKLTTENFNADDPARTNWRNIINEAVSEQFPGADSATTLRTRTQILTHNSQFFLRDTVLDSGMSAGDTVMMNVPVSDPYDQLNKGSISRETPEQNRRLDDDQIAAFDLLVEKGMISRPFNWALFFNADSRFPEIAGLSGAIVGSFYALVVCFLISFPVGIMAATYLEEFAPKNRWTDLIEVNINNLAAVPSIVFGLLGLAVFLQIFGLPRSAPLVGGMVLSLMTLPTIIIATRAALKAVPPSIREAALGVGASRHQVILHHVLPLALPGILTGTIIGLAQALGETAPLLLIGMNAFITSPPGGVFDASTALPTQIYIWADSPERGFVSRTSAGILVLLGFLITMNAIAIFLRQRLERRW